MKANYPVEYMAAVLTADAGNVEKIAESFNECTRMGIPVLPPDVNESFGDFTVIDNADSSGTRGIRFGLHSIKNFGEGIADTIISEREAHGRYESLADFLERVQSKNLNRKSLEALIKSGALDAFEERGKMLHNIETLLTYNREKAAGAANQNSLFGELPDNQASAISLEPCQQTDMAELLLWEKELLGLYVSGHPLDQFREIIKERSKTDISAIKAEPMEGMVVVIPGIIEDARPILTKNGDRMAFLKIADFGDSIEAVAFTKGYAQYQSLLQPERCIAMKARISGRGGETSLICEAVKELKQPKDSKK
jgi:DNA polymerase-3 subunit alpha